MARTFNYQKIAAVAQKMLARFGVVGTVTATDGVTTRQVLIVRDKDVKYILPGATMEGVQVGDAQFWANGITVTGEVFEPLQGEILQWEGEQFTLMAKPNKIKPGNTLLLWQLFGRDGASYV